MTALEMKYEFEISYQLANLFSRNYTNKEISTLLTQAQKDIVLDIVNSENSKFYDNIIKNLKASSEVNTTPTTTFPNAKIAVLQSSIKVLEERVNITLNSTSSFYNINGSHTINNVRVLPITEDYYGLNLKNPDKCPYEELVWSLMIGQNAYLIGSSKYDISSYRQTYIKFPDPIIIADSSYTVIDGSIDGVALTTRTASSLDSVLHVGIHKKIVDRAVLLAVKTSGNTERLQNELQLT